MHTVLHTMLLLVPDDDGGRTFTERGKVRRDVIDLSVCTREKLAHVKDCKAGRQSFLLLFRDYQVLPWNLNF